MDLVNLVSLGFTSAFIFYFNEYLDKSPPLPYIKQVELHDLITLQLQILSSSRNEELLEECIDSLFHERLLVRKCINFIERENAIFAGDYIVTSTTKPFSRMLKDFRHHGRIRSLSTTLLLLATKEQGGIKKNTEVLTIIASEDLDSSLNALEKMAGNEKEEILDEILNIIELCPHKLKNISSLCNLLEDALIADNQLFTEQVLRCILRTSMPDNQRLKGLLDQVIIKHNSDEFENVYKAYFALPDEELELPFSWKSASLLAETILEQLGSECKTKA